MQEVDVPSILFTNLYLGALTGSELHVLQLARQFKSLGWDVTCYTFVSAYPLLTHFIESDVHVIEYGHEEELASAYDVLFAQHHVVSDYLIETHNMSFGCVVVSLLGIKTDHEIPPHFASQADIAVFVSKECEDVHRNAFGEFSGTKLVFPNYATEDFFNYRYTPQAGSQPAVIAVVSNHVTNELRELKEVLPSGVRIDYYGLEDVAIEITPGFLAGCDLVITIGRTVQYCMAQGVPVYCYDVFGGPGYLKPAELDKHAAANFSGRSNSIKRDAEALWNDICSGWKKCLAALPDLQEYSRSNFKFEDHFEILLECIEDVLRRRGEDKRELLTLIAPEYHTKCTFLARTLHTVLMQQFGTVRCFYRHEETGERRITSFKYRYNTQINYSITPRDKEVFEQFSPDIRPCACMLEWEAAKPLNASILESVSLVKRISEYSAFLHANPIYGFDHAASELRFVVVPYTYEAASRELFRQYTARIRSLVDVQEKFTQVSEDNNQLRTELCNALEQVSSLELDLESIRAERTALYGQLQNVKEKAKVDLLVMQTSNEALQKQVGKCKQQHSSLRWTIKHVIYLVLKRLGITN